MNGEFVAGGQLLVSESGVVLDFHEGAAGAKVVEMTGKALLPGFVNAHSHSFQRLIRGKAESRAASGRDFRSWRGMMYHVVTSLNLQRVYDVAQMAFLEMCWQGPRPWVSFTTCIRRPMGA